MPKWKEDYSGRRKEVRKTVGTNYYLMTRNKQLAHKYFAVENDWGITDELIRWSEKYNVTYLDANYSNCAYNLKDKNTKSVEVLVTNYKVS